MSSPEPIMLLRQAVAAMLSRDMDDPVVKAVAVCYQEAAPAFEQVVIWGHGVARVALSEGKLLRPVAELNYPTVVVVLTEQGM